MGEKSLNKLQTTLQVLFKSLQVLYMCYIGHMVNISSCTTVCYTVLHLMATHVPAITTLRSAPVALPRVVARLIETILRSSACAPAAVGVVALNLYL